MSVLPINNICEASPTEEGVYKLATLTQLWTDKGWHFCPDKNYELSNVSDTDCGCDKPLGD